MYLWSTEELGFKFQCLR